MSVLIADKNDLKKSFSIASLAVSDKADKVTSHAKVAVKEGSVIVLTTDEDRMAFSEFKPIEADGTFDFTIEPKKMLDIINGAETDKIKILYEKSTGTLNIFASDKDDSVLSLASFDPDNFLSFEQELNKIIPMGSVDSGMLQTGLKFIQGFMPEEKNPKAEKYTRVYISKGVFYGSNGTNKIGAFKIDCLSVLDDLIIRRSMIAPAMGIIERTKQSKTLIGTTSRSVFFTTEDKSCGFGFLRTIEVTPDFPISLDIPTCTGISISKQNMIKKLGWISLALDKESGIKARLKSDTLTLSTVTGRVSKDSIECKRISGDSDIEFIFDNRLMKSLLGLFQAASLDIFIDKFQCTIISSAELEDLDSKERSPFKAIALMPLARAL